MRASFRWTFLGLLCVIWGSTWLGIKIGLEDLPPFFAAGVRFAVATAILAAVSIAWRVPFPRGRRIHLGLLALGVLNFVINYGTIYWAEQYIPSGLAAVLFATYPLLVLVFAHFAVARERMTARKALGVAIGFAGVWLIFRADLAIAHPRAPIAALVALLAPIGAALGSVGVKRWGHDLHPTTLSTLPMGYGAVTLLAIALATEDVGAVRWTPVAAAATAYLAVFGSVVAFVVYYRLLKDVAVSSLALITYVFPIVAVALGRIVLGERLGREVFVGAVAILLGIGIATWRHRDRGEATLGRGSNGGDRA